MSSIEVSRIGLSAEDDTAGVADIESVETSSAHLVVGHTFGRTVTFGAGAIKEFAAAVGDHNPLHHDEELAARSQFGGVIASGTHTAALIIGAIASYLSARSASLGLDYSVRLKKAVRAGETLTITARVVSITPKPSLNGDIAVIEAEMRNAIGETAVFVRAKSLLTNNRRVNSLIDRGGMK